MTAVKIRGKSELRRTGCRITSGGGDSKESATEIYRLLLQVRVERRGKSSPAAWRLADHVNPIRSKIDSEALTAVRRLPGNRLSPLGNGGNR